MKVNYIIEVDFQIDNEKCILYPQQIIAQGEHELKQHIDLKSILSDNIEGYSVKSVKVSSSTVEL